MILHLLTLIMPGKENVWEVLLLAYFSLDGKTRDIYIRLKRNNQSHVDLSTFALYRAEARQDHFPLFQKPRASLNVSSGWTGVKNTNAFFEGSDKEALENPVEAAHVVARLSSH